MTTIDQQRITNSFVYKTICSGTRFLACKECPIKQEIKDAIVKGSELDTTHVFRSLRNTERVFKNKTSLKVVELEKQRPGEFEVIRPYVSGAMVSATF